jgi:hypothetical protein
MPERGPNDEGRGHRGLCVALHPAAFPRDHRGVIGASEVMQVTEANKENEVLHGSLFPLFPSVQFLLFISSGRTTVSD